LPKLEALKRDYVKENLAKVANTVNLKKEANVKVVAVKAVKATKRNPNAADANKYII